MVDHGLSGFVAICTLPLQIVGLHLGKTHLISGMRVAFDIIGKKETVGNFSFMAIGLCLGLLAVQITSLKKWQKVILIAGVVAQFGLLVLSWHRGTLMAWIIIMGAILFIGSDNLPKLVNRLIPLIIILSIGLFLSNIFLTPLGFSPLDVLKRLFEYSFNVHVPGWDKGRFLMWEYALSIIREHPIFGLGYEAYGRYFFSSTREHMTAPHNYFISSMLQNGIVGTFLQTIIYIYCYWQCFQLFRYSKLLERNNRLIIQAATVGILLWTIPVLTQEVITERYMQTFQHISFGIVSGLVLYIRSNVDKFLAKKETNESSISCALPRCSL